MAEAENDNFEAELNAMRGIAEAMHGLSTEAAQRVLRWACERQGLDFASQPATLRRSHDPNPGAAYGREAPELEGPAEFEDLADFFVACEPRSEADKVLVGAVWQQKYVGREGITAVTLNKELRDLGHRITNITRECNRLSKQRPQLIVQLRKNGTTKQAKKTFRVTAAGFDYVSRMGERLRDAQN